VLSSFQKDEVMKRNFLLLQVRNENDPARDEEYHAFIHKINQCSMPLDFDLMQYDVLTQPLTDDLFDMYDIIFVGGSGEYSVLDDNPLIHSFINFLGTCVERGHPTFASCFGFQALVLALGGEIIKDPDQAEVGTYELELTQYAIEHPLFKDFPKTFLAQLGHQDRATNLPSTLQNLASSERCPFQAFLIEEKNIFATQFHPELTYKDNAKRFARYMPIYGKLFGKEEAIKRMNSHRASPESNTLISKFIERILG
jgi:GMP synthase (glutamine-hydrolysing)